MPQLLGLCDYLRKSTIFFLLDFVFIFAFKLVIGGLRILLGRLAT